MLEAYTTYSSAGVIIYLTCNFRSMSIGNITGIIFIAYVFLWMQMSFSTFLFKKITLYTI